MSEISKRLTREVSKLKSVLDPRNYREHQCTLSERVKDKAKFITCPNFYKEEPKGDLVIRIFPPEGALLDRLCYARNTLQASFEKGCFDLRPIQT